ncbi:hypothetical protein B1810_02305 [Panacagrimonas perspica]|nr:hypothetical protein B1810_02305 [Panacagrimonas perspica]
MIIWDMPGFLFECRTSAYRESRSGVFGFCGETTDAIVRHHARGMLVATPSGASRTRIGTADIRSATPTRLEETAQ